MKFAAEVSCPSCRLTILTGPHSRRKPAAQATDEVEMKCPHCDAVIEIKVRLVRPGKVAP